jgi:import inner membrane translocase subunit TIM44
MSSFAQRLSASQHNAFSRTTSSCTQSFGRSSAYRRLSYANFSRVSRASSLSPQPPAKALPTTWAIISPSSSTYPGQVSFNLRQIHSSARLLSADQTNKPKEATDGEKEASNKEATGSESESKRNTEENTDKEKTQDSEEGSEKDNDQQKKQEEMPPPPPHGDKSPWEVFRETMQQEFNQSKEWNDSTKALASSAHQFSESESVRRARQAYEATSGAVSSTASTVVKTTAGAIGKGAAWTWETPVMKGVRSAANVTGDALDKATKPIRETEAFKQVKDTIDDGSSSRYGGWVEKEERRKRRELRQQVSGADNGQPQVLEEDPEYVPIFH